MNWHQLYTSAIPEERLEVLTLMLQAIESRQHKWVLSKGRLLFERRRLQTAHFIGDRRHSFTAHRIYLAMFIFIIATLSLGIWTVVLHTPPQFAAPLMLSHLAAISLILIVKPRRLQSSPKSVLFGGGAR